MCCLVEVGLATLAGTLSRWLLQETEAAYMKILESSQTLLHAPFDASIDPWVKTETCSDGHLSLGVDGQTVQWPLPSAHMGADSAALVGAVARFGRRVQLIPLDSLRAAQELRGVDAVFLDGDHSLEGISADLQAYSALLGVGGLLVGHDFSWEHPGVVEAVLKSRATCPVTLAPDHVFFWRQGTNASDCSQIACQPAWVELVMPSMSRKDGVNKLPISNLYTARVFAMRPRSTSH
ncbi:unnamed protein product [Effrenium voratum]|nr:unnamed protein product [Effrenium voratum]